MYLKKHKLSGYNLLSGIQILILDSEIDNLCLLTDVLEYEGASVTAASLMSELANPDITKHIDIMLVNIKTIKKYALAKQKRIADVKIPSEIPKIGIADNVQNSDYQDIQDLRCLCYFYKPFDSEEIIRLTLSTIKQPRFYQHLENITNIIY